MLEIKKLHSTYGLAAVHRDFDLQVPKGKVTCLMGRNGAGKTTCLKAIMGLARVTSGVIEMDGVDISKMPAHHRVKTGISYVPQGRRLFAQMSVMENIEVGLRVNHSGDEVLLRLLQLFPRLRERLKQDAGTLSGGEQQMLAMARGLAVEPKLILLDEPTEGLQPSMVQGIQDVIAQLKADGVGVLLVEQRLDMVMAVADEVAFIENGYSRERIMVGDLSSSSRLLHHYVGV